MHRLHQPKPVTSTPSMQNCHPCQSDAHHSTYPLRNRILVGTITVHHQAKMDRRQPEPKPFSASRPNSSIKITRPDSSPRILLRNRNRNSNRNSNRNTRVSDSSPLVAPSLECGGPVCREAMKPVMAITRSTRQRSRPRLDQPHHMFRCRPDEFPG